jgi:hypothetical protein
MAGIAIQARGDRRRSGDIPSAVDKAANNFNWNARGLEREGADAECSVASSTG